jgi:hypothetical protein
MPRQREKPGGTSISRLELVAPATMVAILLVVYPHGERGNALIGSLNQRDLPRACHRPGCEGGRGGRTPAQQLGQWRHHIPEPAGFKLADHPNAPYGPPGSQHERMWRRRRSGDADMETERRLMESKSQ